MLTIVVVRSTILRNAKESVLKQGKKRKKKSNRCPDNEHPDRGHRQEGSNEKNDPARDQVNSSMIDNDDGTFSGQKKVDVQLDKQHVDTDPSPDREYGMYVRCSSELFFNSFFCTVRLYKNWNR